LRLQILTDEIIGLLHSLPKETARLGANESPASPRKFITNQQAPVGGNNKKW